MLGVIQQPRLMQIFTLEVGNVHLTEVSSDPDKNP